MNEARKSAISVFSAIDLRDAERFSNFLAHDRLFAFGNAEPARERDVIADSISGFFSSIAGLKHHVADEWQFDDAMIITSSITRDATAASSGNCRAPASSARLRPDRRLSDLQRAGVRAVA